MAYNNTSFQFQISQSFSKYEYTTQNTTSPNLNFITIYRQGLTYFKYVLACLGVIIYLVNIYSLVIIINLNNLQSQIKTQYIIQFIVNLAIGTLFDISVVFSNFLYQCFYTVLLSYNIHYNIFNIDILNVYICVFHNFLIPVVELIWMWNSVNFTLQRCLIIYFPFLSRKIQKCFLWPLYLFQFIFALALWWINIYSCKIKVIYVPYYYPVCYNSGVLLGSWKTIYQTIASQYISFGAAELIILFSNIVLITKIILAARNRQRLLNFRKAKQKPIENKLTTIIIIGSLLYIILTTPIIFEESIATLIYYIEWLFIFENLLLNFYSYIGKAVFILLRWSDFLLIFLLVSQFRLSFCRFFLHTHQK